MRVKFYNVGLNDDAYSIHRMPSIFIWKATTPFSPTVKTISYYAGSNWFLEDYGTHSKSAMYMDQATLSDNGFLYDIQWMPSNWVGSYVLEKAHVPYALIRTVEYGMLERIGNWMRFTTKHDVPVNERELLWMKIRESVFFLRILEIQKLMKEDFKLVSFSLKINFSS